MKKILFTHIGIIFSLLTYAQCNCETIKRDDGTNVIQCNPMPVASDNTTQVGVGTASNGQDKFISLTVRFKDAAKNISSDLYIRFENNELITFSLVKQELALIGNSQVAQGIYSLSATQIQKIKNSKIRTLSFKLNDGLIRTYKSEKNADILMKQIKCL